VKLDALASIKDFDILVCNGNEKAKDGKTLKLNIMEFFVGFS